MSEPTATTPVAPPTAGDLPGRIGNYQVERLLGEGEGSADIDGGGGFPHASLLIGNRANAVTVLIKCDTVNFTRS